MNTLTDTQLKINFTTLTDSYKIGNCSLLPKGTKKVYSYFEARKGATFPVTNWFGLHFNLKLIEGPLFDLDDIEQGRERMAAHFWGNDTMFNYEGWKKLYNKYGGHLPLEIRAVPEGTLVPVDNVLFTMVNTDEEFPWVTNTYETIMTHVWHPATVATLSYHVFQDCKKALEKSADTLDALPFMLHDFGFRGVENITGAAFGGAGHLVNGIGTDTIIAMDAIAQYYDAPYETIGKSVFATEHCNMTSLGEWGEFQVIQDVLDKNPVGIVSVVSDSYDYYRNVKTLGDANQPYKQQIIDRNRNAGGIPTVYVVRPDSTTPEHKTPEDLVLWTLEQLGHDFGYEVNDKGFRVLDPCVRIIWGDGIDRDGINKILDKAMDNRWSADNLVFGMGGGLLQKVNRDTQRFAFKCSAQLRNDEWIEIQKNPLDTSKKSKAGRLMLHKKEDGTYQTINKDKINVEFLKYKDELQTVYRNGEILIKPDFKEIRERAGFTNCPLY